jgi:glutathione reductase (NADPH)
MHEKGIWGAVTIDWPELMRFKRSFTQPASKQTQDSLKSAGVDIYHGSARFIGRNAIRVDSEVLTGRKIAVASGMVPRRLNLEGEHLLIDSEGFLELEQLPDSIIFIGGGFIAFEFAHIASRVGAKVTILEMSDTILPNFDQDMVKLLLQTSAEIGIDVHTGTIVNSVSRNDDFFNVLVGGNGQQQYSAALVVHGAGRVADIEDLDVKQAGLEVSPHGILVNKYLQSTSNPTVYSAGDAAATPFPLTPTAVMEGEIVAENIIHGNKRTVDYIGIPRVVFTVPPLAAAGILEEEVKAQQIVYESRCFYTSSWFSSRHLGQRHSGAKVLIAKNSKRILGAHLFGHCAEEVINVFSLAIRGNLTVHNLENMVWSYPSLVHDIKYML